MSLDNMPSEIVEEILQLKARRCTLLIRTRFRFSMACKRLQTLWIDIQERMKRQHIVHFLNLKPVQYLIDHPTIECFEVRIGLLPDYDVLHVMTYGEPDTGIVENDYLQRSDFQRHPSFFLEIEDLTWHSRFEELIELTLKKAQPTMSSRMKERMEIRIETTAFCHINRIDGSNKFRILIAGRLDIHHPRNWNDGRFHIIFKDNFSLEEIVDVIKGNRPIQIQVKEGWSAYSKDESFDYMSLILPASSSLSLESKTSFDSIPDEIIKEILQLKAERSNALISMRVRFSLSCKRLREIWLDAKRRMKQINVVHFLNLKPRGYLVKHPTIDAIQISLGFSDPDPVEVITYGSPSSLIKPEDGTIYTEYRTRHPNVMFGMSPDTWCDRLGSLMLFTLNSMKIPLSTEVNGYLENGSELAGYCHITRVGGSDKFNVHINMSITTLKALYYGYSFDSRFGITFVNELSLEQISEVIRGSRSILVILTENSVSGDDPQLKRIELGRVLVPILPEPLEIILLDESETEKSVIYTNSSSSS